MKKYILTGCLLTWAVLGHAQQQPKVLLEIGGGYNKENTASLGSTATNANVKSALLSVRAGTFITKSTALGLAYHREYVKEHAIYLEQGRYMENNEIIISDRENNMKASGNAYGVFFRQYAFAVAEKRWNIFTELNPSYITAKYKTTERGRTRILNSNTPNAVRQSEQTWNAEGEAWDVDLALGGSFKVKRGFSVQIAFRGIANVNRTIVEGAETNFNFLKKPLDNTVISFNYVL